MRSAQVVTAASTPRMYAIDSIMPGSGFFALISYSQPDLPLIADLDQRPEQRRKVDHAAADFDLAFLLGLRRQILHVHVVEAIAALAARLHRIGAGARRVTDVDAEAEAFVARLDRGVGVLRPRPALVLGTVVVDGDLDVVALRQPLDRVERRRLGVDVDQREPGVLRVDEFLFDLERRRSGS